VIRNALHYGLFALSTLGLVACSSEDSGGTGTLQVFVQPEDSIPEGLAPGEGDEAIQDGWSVTYERFLVTLGNVRAGRSDTGDTLSDSTVRVLDLLNAPAGGYIVTELPDIAATRWDRFGFDLPNATPGLGTLPPTSTEDAAFMGENGYSVYFEGALEKADGQSCAPSDPTDCVAAPKVTFRWGLAAGTAFDDCASEDGILGFAVPEGSAVQIKPTIHGDHWFFDNVTAGAEITRRYAQYIADCDLDRDGETTVAELQATPAAQVFPADTYDLGGAGVPIQTAYDFVLAQARTLGDYQGDGECPTRSVLP
jgi:hypothetical protein